MRYAVFSDIHGNRQAWEAVLADMQDLEVQILVCLGDVVGYGPRPQEVLRSVRAHTENVVAGNHDAAAVGLMDDSVFNPAARQAIAWTREQLDEESLSFLSGLPMAIEAQDLFFVHAEVCEPARFDYIETLEDAEQNFAERDHKVTFVGHTHCPTLFRRDEKGTVTRLPDRDQVLDQSKRYIVNVGSVGEPRSLDDIRARYVIYDADSRMLYFRRIEFDPEAYRGDLMNSGLETSPFFLTVFDEQRRDRTADRAMVERSSTPAKAVPSGEEAVRDLVLPAGVEGNDSSAGMPVPTPTPARRRKGLSPALFVLPALVVLVGLVIHLELRNSEGAPDPAPEPEAIIIPWQPEVAVDEVARVGPPLDAGVVLDPVPSGGTDTAEESQPPEPGRVAVVPEPAPDVPVVPPEVSPPPSPRPEETSPEMIGLGEGLLFYASFDEIAGTSVLRDLSPGGRDLPVGSARPGEPGQVGLACRMERSGMMVSEPKPLPADLKGLTISFWLRLPEMTKEAARPEEQVMPSSNLVSLHEYSELRIENYEIICNLDRQGEVVRGEYPRDSDWHHIMVENKEGITTVWIDNLATADPKAERLPEVATGEVAVAIGSPEGNFTIDEVAIWGRSFSSEERVNLHRRGRNGSPLLAPVRTVAYWRFHDDPETRLLKDAEGQNYLGSYKAWTRVPAIAPDPVPLTLEPNTSAAQVLHLSEEPEKAGGFRMSAGSPFTYEGWVKFTGGSGGTLGGALAGEEGGRGWRVAARRARGANGFLAFIHDDGVEKIQALGKDLPLFDGFAHHFAAVWNPGHTATQGRMLLYLDNVEVASAELPLSTLRSDEVAQFRIKAARAPMVLDELRFSSDALEPKRFLTAGLGARAGEDPSIDGESIFERRDREMREKKQRQDEERRREEEERRQAAEERNREAEQRKAEEEAKRSRRKLGIE